MGLHISLYKIFVYFEASVHESIIPLFPPPTCIAHTIAIRLHDYCAMYDPSLRPLFCMPYTIQYWSCEPNIVWCMAYERGVGGGGVYCAMVVQYYWNRVGFAGRGGSKRMIGSHNTALK